MKIAGENDVLAPDTAGTDIVTGRKLAYSVYKAMEMPVVYIDSYEYGYMQYDIDSNKTLKAVCLLYTSNCRQYFGSGSSFY